MKRLLFVLCAAAILVASSPAAADSYVYVLDGKCITNGQAINVKALKAKYSGSYFWFSIGGKSFIVRDRDVLTRMKPIYEPLFDTGIDFSFGEQLSVFAQQMAVMKEQLKLGDKPKPGEDSAIAARRLELKYQQDRLAERQSELAERANASAQAANEYADKLEALNRDIEKQLHDLGAQLVAQRIAVEAR